MKHKLLQTGDCRGFPDTMKLVSQSCISQSMDNLNQFGTIIVVNALPMTGLGDNPSTVVYIDCRQKSENT